MAESPKVEKEDNLEDSLSSEDWTFIYKKESKVNNSTEEKTENEILNDSTENIDTEDVCLSEKNCKGRVENVEVGEEADENELESDDVSILSDESDLEQLTYDGRIERVDWQVERQHSSQLEKPANSLPDGTISSSALITCSIVALVLGIIIAGQIVEFRGDEPNYSVNDEIQEKLRELIGIKKKLNELNDVIHALDEIQVNMPEIKKFKDQLKYQKYEKKKLKYSAEDLKSFEKLNTENILNLNAYDNRLEILETTYQSFCSAIVKIKSTSPGIENKLCKTPKILSDMIIFKKNLEQAFEKTQEKTSPEKRIIFDVERKLDFVSESLLFELKTVFSKFSMKIQERFNKLGYEMHNRLCFLYSSGKINDKFLNILLDKKYFLNNCNESNSDPVTINIKSNATRTNEKNHRYKRKMYEEFKKNNYKYDYKNIKDYKKTHNSKENDYIEKLYNEENVDLKIKGEGKNDNNWKKNKSDKKEKNSLEEKKHNKYEKFDNYKNDYKKNKQRSDYDNLFENNRREYDLDKKFENNKKEYESEKKFENNEKEYDSDKKFENNKKEHFSDKKFESNKKEYDSDRKFENNKREYDSDKKFENNKREYNSDKKFESNKKEYDSNRKFENNKIERDNNRKFENSKIERDYEKKFDDKIDREFDQKVEFNKKDYEFNYQVERKKDNDFEQKFKNKRNYEYDYNEDDSKFIINLENYSDKFIRNDELKQRHKNDKEYVIKLENFKDSKYVRYQGNERRDKRDKYQPNNDWQMQRGKAREKLRNSDWYFVRADSRQKARIDEDGEQETWNFRQTHKKNQGKGESRSRRK